MPNPDDRSAPRHHRTERWRRYLHFFRRRPEIDIDDELRFHVEMRLREYIARGMSEDEARAAVIRRLGDVESVRAACAAIAHRGERRRGRVELLDSLRQDITLASRGLVQQKGWTAVAILTLALGIGATTALFTIINAVLLRPLPYPHSDRIVSVLERRNGVDQPLPIGMSMAWQQSARSFDAAAAYHGASAVLNTGAEPEQLVGVVASASYFKVMGTPASRGRTFGAADDSPGAPPVVVVSDQLWRRAFGADSALLGKTVRMNDTLRTVIGIMPESFTTAHGEQFWIPLQLTHDPRAAHAFFWVRGRLRPGVTPLDAARELAVISGRVEAKDPGYGHSPPPIVVTLREQRYGDARTPLLLLLGAVGFLLLIACANVANLMLVRAAGRQKEFAVRVALGASRWRLVRYLLCESTLLSLIGGVIGLLISTLTVGFVVRSSPLSIAHAEGIRVDGVVLAFAFVLSAVTGLVFGLVPALESGRSDFHEVLKDGVGTATSGGRRHRIRRALVVAELAISLILVTGAGLLIQSFTRVASIDPWLQRGHVIVAQINLSAAQVGDRTSWRASASALTIRVRNIPGVQSAAVADVAPLQGSVMSMTFRLKDGTELPLTDACAVTPGYFETLGIPVVSGRVFTEADAADSNPVAVINATMARLLFREADPIGKELPMWLLGRPHAVVIGVVQDVAQQGLEATPRPEMYGLGVVNPYPTLLVRITGDPAAVERPLRDVLRSLDPFRPVASLTTMDAIRAELVAPRRFSFMLLGILASLAVVLAAIGLYGVMAFSVAERHHELGIRVALGADSRRVMRLVVGEGMLLTLLGVTLGFIGSIGAVRLLRSLVFHVSVYDPSTFLVATGVLAFVSLVACYFPARRATRVDPMVALRGG